MPPPQKVSRVLPPTYAPRQRTAPPPPPVPPLYVLPRTPPSHLYWYIGSMPAISRMQKKRMALYAPPGLYPVRAASISLCVRSAMTSLSWISLEMILASDRIWIALASSRMLP